MFKTSHVPVISATLIAALLGIDDVRQRSTLAGAWDVTGPGIADGYRIGTVRNPVPVHLRGGDEIMAALRNPMTEAACVTHVSRFTRDESSLNGPIPERIAVYFVADARGDGLGACYVLHLQAAPWLQSRGKIYAADARSVGVR